MCGAQTDHSIPADFTVDINERLGEIERTLMEPRVASARYRLVPRKLSEAQFWRAVFWRLHCAQMRIDDSGCLSPAQRPRASDGGPLAVALPVDASKSSVAPLSRHPLTCRTNETGWESWDSVSPGSPGECQRGGVYTPRGTSVHGYDEFGG